MTKQEIAAVIDHTLLRPEATKTDIQRLCREARTHDFKSVCVNPYWAPFALSELVGSPVLVCTVVGFPLGASATAAKSSETMIAIHKGGAREIDMVLNIGELRGGNCQAVQEDIEAVVNIAHGEGAIVKVILETALLDEGQKRTACLIAKQAGADFVKTSTGFGGGGATTGDVALMREAVGSEMGVKASGGIRTLDDVENMLNAGATRIGTSSGAKIIESV